MYTLFAILISFGIVTAPALPGAAKTAPAPKPTPAVTVFSAPKNDLAQFSVGLSKSKPAVASPAIPATKLIDKKLSPRAFPAVKAAPAVSAQPATKPSVAVPATPAIPAQPAIPATLYVHDVVTPVPAPAPAPTPAIMPEPSHDVIQAPIPAPAPTPEVVTIPTPELIVTLAPTPAPIVEPTPIPDVIVPTPIPSPSDAPGTFTLTRTSDIQPLGFTFYDMVVRDGDKIREFNIQIASGSSIFQSVGSFPCPVWETSTASRVAIYPHFFPLRGSLIDCAHPGVRNEFVILGPPATNEIVVTFH